MKLFYPILRLRRCLLEFLSIDDYTFLSFQLFFYNQCNELLIFNSYEIYFQSYLEEVFVSLDWRIPVVLSFQRLTCRLNVSQLAISRYCQRNSSVSKLFYAHNLSTFFPMTIILSTMW